jgi:hypothetical protein
VRRRPASAMLPSEGCDARWSAAWMRCVSIGGGRGIEGLYNREYGQW